MGVERPEWYFWVLIIVGMTTVTVLFIVGLVAPSALPKAFVYFVDAAFGIGWSLHIIEGMYAFLVASKYDTTNKYDWFFQTLLLGYPSLRLLLKRKNSNVT